MFNRQLIWLKSSLFPIRNLPVGRAARQQGSTGPALRRADGRGRRGVKIVSAPLRPTTAVFVAASGVLRRPRTRQRPAGGRPAAAGSPMFWSDCPCAGGTAFSWQRSAECRVQRSQYDGPQCWAGRRTERSGGTELTQRDSSAPLLLTGPLCRSPVAPYATGPYLPVGAPVKVGIAGQQ
jgi:hypothetical protein